MKTTTVSKISIIFFLLYEQNSSACATHLLVHFLDVHCMTMTWSLLMQHFIEDMSIQWWIFLPLFWTRINLKNSTPAGPNRCIIINFEMMQIHFLVTFSLLLSSLLFKCPNDVIVKMVYYYWHLFLKVKAVMFPWQP